MKPSVVVLYHIFFEDTVDHIAEQLACMAFFKPTYLFNICSDTPNQFEIKKELLKNFPNSIITISSNQGKDIGGKMLLLATCIQMGLQPGWIVFLHDKKSLQALNTKTWKRELFKIIDCGQTAVIDAIISNPSSYGIIASKNYVTKELRTDGKFTGNNGQLLERLLCDYQINCKTFDYVAGTMFWARADAMLNFFKKFDPLKIRQQLEYGNVLDNFSGTYTHSWERLLCWIVLSDGLTIKSI
ncbi:MAG: rhamnan synthesis F family protein [Chitinophagaceae bacterium]